MYENDKPDVTKSDEEAKTTNIPIVGPATILATKELVGTDIKENIKKNEMESSKEIGGDISESTSRTDILVTATSASLEQDLNKKEKYAEDAEAPATGEDTHTPIGELEEFTSSGLSQQDEANITTLSETAIDHKVLPQEESLSEVAVQVAIKDNLLTNEEESTNHNNMEVGGSSLAQEDDKSTLITTTPETQESNVELAMDENLLPLEEGEASHTNMQIEGSPSSQQYAGTTTSTAAESKESPPQEESPHGTAVEVAIDESFLPPERGGVAPTNMKVEEGSPSQYQASTTITTAAEIQESPPKEESPHGTAVEVAIDVNPLSSEAEPNSSQKEQAVSTTSPQMEDDNTRGSSVEAGRTPQVDHFYVEGSVGNNRRVTTQPQKKKRRRRNLKIAIGVILVIIIGLGIGIGFLVADSKDSKELTTAATTTISTTTIATTDGSTTTSMISTPTTTTPKMTTTTTVSPSFISKAEMHNFTSGLIDLDDNNMGKKVKVDHQNKTQEGTDQTYGPLLDCKKGAMDGPTLTPFVALLDNYEAAVGNDETTTEEEEEEQKEFLDAVMETEIMKATEEFMRNKTFDGSLRDYLQQIWFTPYSRSWTGAIDTSGFEHTFVGEQKDGHVLGFQNWVNFCLQEKNDSLMYKGWKKSISLKPWSVIPNPLARNKGEILELSFEWQGNTRSLDNMFIGSSPELELALYTLCYWAKLGEKCHVQLNNHKFVIHTSDYGALGVVGSAYPDISSTII
ncbi:unnamed protein product [Meganyctiphanes norvegica]|uniref:EndoU domain-containing protein n=1 Tax=Meganyctiphanes norvegica TaxID=48144 RepID=A0AAV2QLJ8_MEGNR